MPALTYLKTVFQSLIAPGDDERFLRIVQEADVRLLQLGRWFWTRARTTLTPLDGYVTLDPAHASILGVQVGEYATDIRDETWEFTPDGVGDIQIGTGNCRLIDNGLNEEGLRQYKVTGHLPADITLTALVLRAPAILFDPDIADSSVPEEATDETRCPSTYALKFACQGIVMEEEHDLDAGKNYFQSAIEVLEGEQQNKRGGAHQTLNLRPNGPGIRGIRTYR